MIRQLLSAAGSGEAVWTPAALFANSEVGVWYDPSDINTLFQDDAGTTPVTTAGQTVGMMQDLSGNEKHATQATLANRPVYQIDGSGYPYLEFDGSNDFMTFPTLGAGLLRTIWAVWKLRDTGTLAILIESSVNFSSTTGWLIDREFGSPKSLSVSQKGGLLNIGYVANQPITSLQVDRIEMDRQSSSDYAQQRKAWVDGVAQTITPHVYLNNIQNVGFYDGPHYLGARSGGSSPSQLNFYGAVLVNTIHDTDIKAAADQYWMNKVGL